MTIQQDKENDNDHARSDQPQPGSCDADPRGEDRGDSMQLEGVTLYQAAGLITINKEEAERQYARAEALELKYRKELWLNHGHSGPAIYGDDGEMQCSACMPLSRLYDYRRAPLAAVEEAANTARMHRISEALADASVVRDAEHAAAAMGAPAPKSHSHLAMKTLRERVIDAATAKDGFPESSITSALAAARTALEVAKEYLVRPPANEEAIAIIESLLCHLDLGVERSRHGEEQNDHARHEEPKK